MNITPVRITRLHAACTVNMNVKAPSPSERCSLRFLPLVSPRSELPPCFPPPGLLSAGDPSAGHGRDTAASSCGSCFSALPLWCDLTLCGNSPKNHPSTLHSNVYWLNCMWGYGKSIFFKLKYTNLSMELAAIMSTQFIVLANDFIIL